MIIIILLFYHINLFIQSVYMHACMCLRRFTYWIEKKTNKYMADSVYMLKWFIVVMREKIARGFKMSTDWTMKREMWESKKERERKGMFLLGVCLSLQLCSLFVNMYAHGICAAVLKHLIHYVTVLWFFKFTLKILLKCFSNLFFCLVLYYIK